MRGHRSRLHLPALALLLGVAGALSLAQGALVGLSPRATSVLDAGSPTSAVHSPEWGATMEPLRGSIGRGLVQERSGPGQLGGMRPLRIGAAIQGVSSTTPALGSAHSPPRRRGFGARLLGLERSPANAPPRS
jgi:hypothetical protein